MHAAILTCVIFLSVCKCRFVLVCCVCPLFGCVPTAAAALERTYLSWLSMAVTMGGVSSVLMSFSNDDAHGEEVGVCVPVCEWRVCMWMCVVWV